MKVHQKTKLTQIRRLRGATLVETMTAAALSVLTVFASINMFLSGMKSWAHGEGRISAERYVQDGIRQISMELRQAMAVTVDQNGQGLSYELPEVDDNGAYVVPPTWDGVQRRIEYYNGVIRITGTKTHTIVSDVILTDPLSTNGNTPYQIFTAGPGVTTRQLTIMIATQTAGSGQENVNSRVRETLYLRNIPSLTR